MHRTATRGWHAVGRLLGSYWFPLRRLEPGPFLKLTYELVVREFSEQQRQHEPHRPANNDAFWSSLGWRVAGNVSGFRPFARHVGIQPRTTTASCRRRTNNLNSWYTMPAFAQDNNWALFDVGVSRDFRRHRLISANASAGKNDGDYWSVTVGIARRCKPLVATRAVRASGNGNPFLFAGLAHPAMQGEVELSGAAGPRATMLRDPCAIVGRSGEQRFHGAGSPRR